MIKLEELNILERLDLDRTIKSINTIYKNIKNKYSQYITSKDVKQIGGTYYGSTQLFSTSGIHFNMDLGYIDHGYCSSTYYDFIFKIGGEHQGEFNKYKQKFINEFFINMEKLLIKKGFIKDDLSNQNIKSYNINYKNNILNISLIGDVSYGTNFSTICGIRIDIKDEKGRKKLRKEYIKNLIF